MTKLGQKMYVKGRSMMDRFKKEEKGSTAVEFMGIAAVAVVVIIIIFNFFDGDDSTGGNIISNIFTNLLDGVLNWLPF